MSENLFCDGDGRWFKETDILESLKQVGAGECDILVVQTGVSFGFPNTQLNRKEYMDRLYQQLLAIHVDTLVVPVFTYSFCNGENFDVKHSKTSMGALAEYIRNRPAAKRSLDPLLSMVVIGKEKNIFDGDLGNHSFGESSAYDRLHKSLKKVKFLCYGTEFSEYFTYIHYIEKQINVPYRFDMTFQGKITDWNGKTYENTHSIHTACGGVKPANFPYFQDWLITKGVMKQKKIGNTNITCVAEEDVYCESVKKLRENIYYFLQQPFTNADLTYEYQYGKNGERVTHC